MNWDRIQAKRKELHGKAQQQWGKLSDDDVTLVDGKREELAGRLQERYGLAKEDAEKQIDSWLRAL